MEEKKEHTKPVEVQDELGDDITELTKDQLKKEIENFKKNLEQLDKDKENYEKQWEVDKELHQIQLEGDNHMLINPTYKYQQNPRYWELVKEKLKYQIRQQTAQAEGYLKSIELRKKPIIEQLESSQEMLDKLEKGNGE